MFWFIVVTAFLMALTSVLPLQRTPFGSVRSKRSGKVAQVEDLFSGRFTSARSKNLIIDKGHMIRCHNCSVYVRENQVQREVVQGHILEFCSQNCRRNFLAPN